MLKKNILFLAAISTLFLSSCDDRVDPTTLPASQSTTTTGGTTSGAAAIALTATPATLTVNGTSSIQATVTTGSGANVANGTSVSFTLNNSAMGTISSQATTFNGVATATFTAATVPGTVIITASTGGVSQTVTVTINAPTTGSIQFVSATPQVIGIKGGGQTATSLVTFLVNDLNGNPVVDGVGVSFAMSGPSGGRLPANGGEYIGDLDTTPTTATASTVNGNAVVTLNSGAVAGPVTIIASVIVGGQTVSSASTPISIGGGVPSATHFNLAATRLNLAGLVYSNKQTTVSAFIADRFGNYNVLTGTSVSFYTEAGAIDTSNVTDATGATSVILRTQAPDPVDTPPIGSPNPADGWVTVLATVQGEEAFNDSNGNGLYDTGESFADLGEPFIDKDDNGIRDTSPFEEYIDASGNGVYDGPNGVWDGPGCSGAGCQSSKMIWTSLTLAFTGNAFVCTISPNPFTITNGTSQSFTFTLGDINTNSLVPGTTITVTATIGTLSGQTSYTLPDIVGGPTVIFFNILDPDTDTIVDTSTITVDVVSPEVIGCKVTASGTVE